jgi:Cu-Zn family superoxide dismutase
LTAWYLFCIGNKKTDMKRNTIAGMLGCGIVTAFCSLVISCSDGTNVGTSGTDTDSAKTAGASAIANLSATYPDTTVNGMVKFETQDDGDVKMTLDITIPAKANQTVAVHIHEHADCGDTGHHAGGHWNPTNTQHGKWGSSAFHSGDIGNVQLDASGRGTLELETNLWSVGGDSTRNILNRAIIVHGGTDDFTTQPTGNAGNRIACGVITGGS